MFFACLRIVLCLFNLFFFLLAMLVCSGGENQLLVMYFNTARSCWCQWPRSFCPSPRRGQGCGWMGHGSVLRWSQVIS